MLNEPEKKVRFQDQRFHAFTKAGDKELRLQKEAKVNRTKMFAGEALGTLEIEDSLSYQVDRGPNAWANDFVIERSECRAINLGVMNLF